MSQKKNFKPYTQALGFNNPNEDEALKSNDCDLGGGKAPAQTLSNHGFYLENDGSLIMKVDTSKACGYEPSLVDMQLQNFNTHFPFRDGTDKASPVKESPRCVVSITQYKEKAYETHISPWVDIE